MQIHSPKARARANRVRHAKANERGTFLRESHDAGADAASRYLADEGKGGNNGDEVVGEGVKCY
ncbi:MAG TPA: hypothetical protein ENN11_04490 [Methanomicrobia archaeon]|nr:hypothetical protein [Methanomicrobia archaeon]